MTIYFNKLFLCDEIKQKKKIINIEITRKLEQVTSTNGLNYVNLVDVSFQAIFFKNEIGANLVLLFAYLRNHGVLQF